MSTRYTVAIGAACVDEYYETDRWPQEGDKAMVRETGRQAGGMIPNAASVLAGYGEKVYLLDSMCESPSSRWLRENLESEYHVDTSKVQIDPALPDGRCIIALSDGERTILVVDRGNFQRRLDEETERLLLDAACVYTSVMEFRRFPEPEKLAVKLRECGVHLVFDVEPSTLADACDPLLPLAGVLFFNEQGIARYAAGRSESVRGIEGVRGIESMRGIESAQGIENVRGIENVWGIESAAAEQKLSEDYLGDAESCVSELLAAGVQCVVVTLGSEGCLARTADETIRLPGIRVDVVDTTGAGDTYNSSFVHGLLEGWTIRECASFANAAAARAVTKAGPKGGVCPEAEVIAFQNEHQNG